MKKTFFLAVCLIIFVFLAVFLFRRCSYSAGSREMTQDEQVLAIFEVKGCIDRH